MNEFKMQSAIANELHNCIKECCQGLFDIYISPNDQTDIGDGISAVANFVVYKSVRTHSLHSKLRHPEVARVSVLSTEITINNVSIPLAQPDMIMVVIDTISQELGFGELCDEIRTKVARREISTYE